MVESFLSGKKARSPIMGITGVRGITGFGGYTGYEGSTGYGYTGSAGYTGVSGSTGIRGWSIFDRGSSNFFNASWVADPSAPMAYPTYTDGGNSSFIRVNITGTGPEAFLAGTKARVGKPFLQGLTDFLRRWNFPGAGL